MHKFITVMFQTLLPAGVKQVFVVSGADLAVFKDLNPPHPFILPAYKETSQSPVCCNANGFLMTKYINTGKHI